MHAVEVPPNGPERLGLDLPEAKLAVQENAGSALGVGLVVHEQAHVPRRSQPYKCLEHQ